MSNQQHEALPATGGAARLYLDLLKLTLTHSLWGDAYVPVGRSFWSDRLRRPLKKALYKTIAPQDIHLMRRVPFDAEKRRTGRDWPVEADTMIGLERLNNLHECIESVLAEGVPGDFIETGVWRGGSTIFMRAALKAYGVEDRLVWVADSFEGLPPPDAAHEADAGAQWHTFDELRVSMEQVQDNFRRYGLLDDRVRFLKGWFSDTLPTAPIEQLAILRLDGDMYGSTIDALDALFDKVSVGGYVIVDDYGIPEDGCRRAIHDFRRDRGIEDPIVDIDGFGAYWRRT